MSARRVITHVVESEPLFITLSHQTSWFASQFSGGGILWKHLAIAGEISAETTELFQEAHLIVVDVAGCSVAEREKLITSLLPHQQKTKLILPIYSFWQLKMLGEIPGWQDVAVWQQSQVVRWMGSLPDAAILFVRDVIDWWQGHPLSTLLVQNWSDGMFFIPDGKLAPCRRQDVVHLLIEEIGSPRRGSVIIQGSEFLLSSMCEVAIPLYESMYGVRVEQQRVVTLPSELLPFSCRIRELSQSLDESANQVLSLFSTPTKLQHSGAAIKALLQSIAQDPWVKEANQIVAQASTLTPLPAEEQTSSSNQVSMQKKTDSSEPTKTILSAPIIEEKPTEEVVTGVEKEQQLQEDVRRLFSTQGVKQHTQTIRRKSQQRRVVKKRSRKRTAVFYIGLVFVSTGLLLAAFLGIFQVTQQLVRREFASVVSGISETKVVSSDAVHWGTLPQLFSIMEPQQELLSSIFLLPVVDAGKTMVVARLQLQEALLLHDDLRESASEIYAVVTSQSTGDIAQTTDGFLKKVDEATKLSATLFETATQLPEPLNSSFASVSAQLLPSNKDRRSELLSSTLLPGLPTLTGVGSQRRYAVVLQNSQELRPTGGFIEAIAILTFSNGGLISQDIYSSYQLDARLPGKITAPADLTSTIGENQWWLHDSNWYADGAASGRQITWFLEKILQQPVDGVVFINTAGLPQLLRALGPMEMKDFNEVLTDKNIGERLEFHNELPNQVATGKSEYRQELLRQLLSKLTTLVPEQVPTFYQTIDSLLEEKQVLLFFAPPDEQQLFRKLGWTGDLTFPTCPTAYIAAGCVADGLALIETNIGANRANAYISRTQEHNAALSPSGIHHERKIQYTNAAATSAWPKGDYNVYLRAYVPGRPTNILVTLDGVPLKSTAVAVRDSDFGIEISFLITIPIASSKELLLSYDQEQPLSPTSTYVFYENRQAGLIDPIAPLNVSYPNDWVVSSRIPNAIKFGSQLLFPESPSSYLMRVIQFTPAQ